MSERELEWVMSLVREDTPACVRASVGEWKDIMRDDKRLITKKTMRDIGIAANQHSA